VRAYSDVITNAEAFNIEIPQFSTLETPEAVYTLLDTLIDLGNQPQAIARWRQHLLFQSLLQELSHAYQPVADVGRQVAEQTAAFLRQHYREEISYALLKEQLHFHPSYLSRCMRRIFGVTPLEYLIDWRIEQSKRLLINTILPVSQVAGNVGFHHQSYFIRCFTRREGITPQVYRKQFSM
jgi:AraC-like DNA-binding protein